MSLLSVLDLLNACLVLIFGLFLSVLIAGSWETKRQKKIVLALCLIFLLMQGLLWFFWDETTVEHFYPLIVHLPIVLFLVFVLKKNVYVSLVSVLTAYLCCQLQQLGQLHHKNSNYLLQLFLAKS